MQPAPKVWLVVVLLLLASVGTVSAVCAWVLWGDQYDATARPFEQVQWERYFVYPTYAACWAKITELTVNDVQRPGSWTDTFQRWVGTGQYRSGAIAHRYGDKVVINTSSGTAHWVCYPDTIDPRGPKGSSGR